MGLDLIGFGTRVPEHGMAQAEAAALNASFATTDERKAHVVQALYRRTGVKRRHSVLLDEASGALAGRQAFYPPASGDDDEGPSTSVRMERYESEAPALAEGACIDALRDAEVDSSDITHIVTVSCTGFFAPGLAPALIERLGLPPGVERTHVGFMGCHGALNGLRVASGFGGADPGARVLVASVELCSLHFAYGWDPERIVANALFSDGAAAVVGVSPNGAAPEWRVAATGTYLIPDSEEAMSWRIGDHGFRMTLSAAVPDLIQEHLAGWLEGWLAESDLSPSDIRSWAVHPGGPRVLSSVRKALDLEPDAIQPSRDILARHGNMSSATVLFILDALRERRAPRPCVALAFGPGLVAEATLLL